MDSQQTLRRSVSCRGTALHSGKTVTLSLRPAPVDYGIRFQRSDLGGLEIPATVTHLGGIQYQAGLTREAVSVETVEHLLAALTGLGIDNVIIDLDQPELPIMDGSALLFVSLIKEAGIHRLSTPRRYLKVLRPIELTQGDRRIALYPAQHFSVTYSISFDHPLLRHQTRSMRISEESFIAEIAPARTFGFLKEVEMLQQRGLALGGSFDNAIVLDETSVLNTSLRFEDEFVRHKILDAVGDLTLVGYPVIGHLVAHRGGHALHTAFAARILEDTGAWKLIETSVEVDQITTSSGLHLVEVIDVSPHLLQLLREDIRVLNQLNPDQFEGVICNRLDRMGLDVQRVGHVNARDGGVDIVAWPREGFRFLLAVQAKHHRYSRNTGPEAVKNLLATVNTGPFQAGMLVTNTTFTPHAKWFAAVRPHLVRLRDIADLSRWLMDDFLAEETWREIPTRITLAPGVVVDLKQPLPDDVSED
jgi:UDP-3-O-[3-hydroxymyristoyl] N-acetylglucosamine deacetylase